MCGSRGAFVHLRLRARKGNYVETVAIMRGLDHTEAESIVPDSTKSRLNKTKSGSCRIDQCPSPQRGGESLIFGQTRMT